MVQSGYLIDSNAVIDYLGKRFPDSGMHFMNDIVDVVPNVSVITQIEVLGFDTSRKYYQLLENFIEDADVLDLAHDIVYECIRLRKEHTIRLPDAIIASTALAYDFTLVTRNIDDFKYIDKLRLLNPHEV